jgi:hypothetical protein
MITNHAQAVINSFERMKLPKQQIENKKVGMMARSRPPMQSMDNDVKKQPAIIAKEIYDHIKSANMRYKNGGDDGTIV